MSRRLRPGVRARLRRVRLGATSLGEAIAFGGHSRERLLVRLLAAHYRSRYRREWLYQPEPPHFWNHRIGWFRIGFEDDAAGASVYTRAFLSAEVIRPGDVVLDIGCGDGFITRRFLAENAAAVHGVDVEPTAISMARAFNGGANVEYFQRDATTEPFPAEKYDIVVWDGAMAHFDPSTTAAMLEKIRASLNVDGVFAGSESLGDESSDHLQLWDTIGDLEALLTRHFPSVEVKERAMMVGLSGSEFMRREAYWRCALDPQRLASLAWSDGARSEPGSASGF